MSKICEVFIVISVSKLKTSNFILCSGRQLKSVRQNWINVANFSWFLYLVNYNFYIILGFIKKEKEFLKTETVSMVRLLAEIVESPSVETVKTWLAMVVGNLFQLTLFEQVGWTGWSQDISSNLKDSVKSESGTSCSIDILGHFLFL